MKTLLLLEALLALALTVVYGLRSDGVAALTILPAWAWLLLAAPVFPFLQRRHLPRTLVFLSAWLLFILLHVEEPRSVARGLIHPATESKPPGALRLVTLNCGGGQIAALHELKGLDPDVVFLQETPPPSNVVASAQALFGTEGDWLCDADTALLVRGRLTQVKQDGVGLFYSHAAATLPGIGAVDLFSLRLLTGHVRIDLWNPTCWSLHRQHRRRQLDEMRQIARELPAARSLFMAGDFNAPQGDRIFAFLRPHLYDTFAVAGRGIGNTMLNDMPVLRIDQIWVSRDFETLQSFARPSKASDHRIVISDVRRMDARPGSGDPRR